MKPGPKPLHCLRVAGLALLAGIACKSATPDPYTAWSAGDGLFQSDPRFAGGDGAYSIALSEDRIVWLFGDSFVGPRTGRGRSGLPLTRNAVAIQDGRDPATATMAFSVSDEPFFGTAEERWLWPGPGVRVGDTLVVGLIELAASDEGLGFTTVGSKVATIDNPDEDADRWSPRITSAPTMPASAQIGFGAWLHEGDATFLFAPVEPGSHDVMLARWPDAAIVAPDFAAITWWQGNDWTRDASSAEVVAAGVQTEFSVHRAGDELWMVSVDGFGGTNVVVRTAGRPSGPWSAPRTLLRPPESAREGILVYSAKAHPALASPSSDGPLITYCTNHTDFGTMVHDMELYFPRFIAPKSGA